jgi:hypothetical protein
MKATQKLHELGQSIWLDNITRDLLTSGTLRRYLSELSLTGLTSNPTIFDQAIKSSSAYDSAIRAKLKQGKSGEKLFFELAIEDLSEAADIFRPVWDRTNGVDGWVSLEVSPLLAWLGRAFTPAFRAGSLSLNPLGRVAAEESAAAKYGLWLRRRPRRSQLRGQLGHDPMAEGGSGPRAGSSTLKDSVW